MCLVVKVLLRVKITVTNSATGQSLKTAGTPREDLVEEEFYYSRLYILMLQGFHEIRSRVLGAECFDGGVHTSSSSHEHTQKGKK